ncbi:MAG: polyprenyl synthetase family protein, partial [Thermoguttaceae bacterium]
MSQTIERTDPAPRELRSLYAVVRDELGQVDEVLRQELTSRYPFVHKLAQHGFRLGGKRLRPALVLLSGKLCGRVNEDHFRLAAAVEMVHTATLVHDDVLDEAVIRRHLETVNARWDNETSILLGDYLFAKALGLTVAIDDAYATRCLIEASRRVCEGELRQLGACGDYDLTESDYLEIIDGKTAALCACCCEIGAHYAGASKEDTAALTRFGDKLGVAFQIIDDVLDVLGDEKTTGKSLGTDLVKRKPTLPLIRLLEQSDPTERARMIEVLSTTTDHHREALWPWLKDS